MATSCYHVNLMMRCQRAMSKPGNYLSGLLTETFYVSMKTQFLFAHLFLYSSVLRPQINNFVSLVHNSLNSVFLKWPSYNGETDGPLSSRLQDRTSHLWVYAAPIGFCSVLDCSHKWTKSTGFIHCIKDISVLWIYVTTERCRMQLFFLASQFSWKRWLVH